TSTSASGTLTRTAWLATTRTSPFAARVSAASTRRLEPGGNQAPSTGREAAVSEAKVEALDIHVFRADRAAGVLDPAEIVVERARDLARGRGCEEARHADRRPGPREAEGERRRDQVRHRDPGEAAAADGRAEAVPAVDHGRIQRHVARARAIDERH